MNEFFHRLRRVLRKPPKVIFERILYEIKAELGRIWEPLYPHFITLRTMKSSSVEDLWNALGKRPYLTEYAFINKSDYETQTGDSVERILKLANQAMNNKVNLLGSGLIDLGDKIDWSRDYKSSYSWPLTYFRSIRYGEQGKPHDVKFPWELSRMQWMIPLGQAYLLTKDEAYAQKTKELIMSWFQANPFACSVNWACTMDVALRLIVWTWFFHVFKDSPSWNDSSFKWEFLKSLYLHGFFTSRHLEKSDVNGNHYTADAAGLAFAGLFFGEQSWQTQGWNILEGEINLQVHEDGVDFEASVPYHRLVEELFFYPALYRMKQGLEVSNSYKERLCKMAYFTACYSREDGSSPIWGDADDARVLPFGNQTLNDHRYLIGFIGHTFSSKELLNLWSGPKAELFWIFDDLPSQIQQSRKLTSESFPEGGFYIIRDDKNHIFIDCGPLGLKGRGGHGHNDILAFEAVLDHTPLIIDPGSFLYTSDFNERNLFRSTPSHNTPQIDGEEINRFIRPDYLWNLHNDAHPELHDWTVGKDITVFKGSHTGYQRLDQPVKPVRTIQLDHKNCELILEDFFEGKGSNKISIPLHFHPSVNAEKLDENNYLLKAKENTFKLTWDSPKAWNVLLESTRISPSYGVVEDSKKLVFNYQGPVGIGLKIRVSKVSEL